MSSIFGVFNRDGHPVSPSVLATMMQAASYWEPDYCGSWTDGAVGVGHCLLANTPGSGSERQPFPFAIADGDAELVVSADARLDNRSELARLLQLSSQAAVEHSDAHLIARAWLRWGEDCPRYLLGDFAIAIWDSRRQTMYCIRDHVGIRPLYYSTNGYIHAFASDIRVLDCLNGSSGALDEEALALYLTEGELRRTERTLLSGIKRVPPASVLAVSRDDFRVSRYWSLGDAPALSHDGPDETKAAFSELLSSAVTVRTRSEHPITTHLSGGLDSGAIAVIAARELERRGEQLTAANWAPAPGPNDDPAYYEWAHARRIAQQEGMALSHVKLNSEDIAADLLNTDIALGHALDFWYEAAVQGLARDSGSRVILSGWGGDELISHSGDAVYADLFWHGQWRKAFRGIWAHASLRPGKLRNTMSLVLHQLVVPALPAWIRNRIDGSYFAEFDCLALTSPWFRAFADRHRRRLFAPPTLSNRSRMLSLFDTGYLQSRVEGWAASAWQNRVEYRYPLLDKRVLEFAVGLAPEYFRQQGQGRFLFRQVSEDLLGRALSSQLKRPEDRRVAAALELEERAIEDLARQLESTGWGSNDPGSRDAIDKGSLLTAMKELKETEWPSDDDRIYATQTLIMSIRAARLQEFRSTERAEAAALDTHTMDADMVSADK